MRNAARGTMRSILTTPESIKLLEDELFDNPNHTINSLSKFTCAWIRELFPKNKKGSILRLNVLFFLDFHYHFFKGMTKKTLKIVFIKKIPWFSSF